MTAQLAAVAGIGLVVGLGIGFSDGGLPSRDADRFVRPAPPTAGPGGNAVAIDPDELAQAEAQRTQARVLVVAPPASAQVATLLADRLRAAGWTNVTVGDDTDAAPATIVFHRAGFDVVAELVVIDLGIGELSLSQLPELADGAADVVDVTVVLSADVTVPT